MFRYCHERPAGLKFRFSNWQIVATSMELGKLTIDYTKIQRMFMEMWRVSLSRHHNVKIQRESHEIPEGSRSFLMGELYLSPMNEKR